MNSKEIVHVILTGGVGSRLWPLSRKSMPKQYLEIFQGKSLFEMALERNSIVTNKLIVVGNKDNTHLSRQVIDKTNKKYIDIVEATPRNTAAAIAFAAFAANPEAVLIVTPSDHIIKDDEAYKTAIEAAVEKASNGAIVTFGIIPTKPNTGYGYIEFQSDNVLSFREKPDAATAKEFLQKGNFLWNSGMFCFKAKVLLEELKKFQPNIYEKAKIAWEQSENGRLDNQLSLDIPSLSIDYAVMEKSKKIKVVPAKFQWSDLGSFDSVYEYLVENGYPIDENGNMVIGTSVFTSFLGLKNTIFVATENANLILQKEHSQEVKDIYNLLESENSELLD